MLSYILTPAKSEFTMGTTGDKVKVIQAQGIHLAQELFAVLMLLSNIFTFSHPG